MCFEVKLHFTASSQYLASSRSGSWLVRKQLPLPSIASPQTPWPRHNQQCDISSLTKWRGIVGPGRQESFEVSKLQCCHNVSNCTVTKLSQVVCILQSSGHQQGRDHVDVVVVVMHLLSNCFCSGLQSRLHSKVPRWLDSCCQTVPGTTQLQRLMVSCLLQSQVDLSFWQDHAQQLQT